MRKGFRKALDILVIVANPILSGILVNLVSTNILEGQSLIETFGQIGWWWLVLPLWIITFIVAIVMEIIHWREEKKIRDLIRLENKKELVKQLYPQIDDILEALSDSIHLQVEDLRINVHVFLYEETEAKGRLVKQRSILKEPFAKEKTLIYADIEAHKDLVICKSFTRNEIVYENLKKSHIKDLPQDIQPHIDKDIRWVMAAPIGIQNHQPFGVIDFFGKDIKPFESDRKSRKILETILIRYSNLIRELILYETTIPDKELDES